MNFAGLTYYVTLGNKANCASGGYDYCVPVAGWGLTNSAYFENLQAWAYWSSVRYNGWAWSFQNYGGWKSPYVTRAHYREGSRRVVARNAACGVANPHRVSNPAAVCALPAAFLIHNATPCGSVNRP